MAIKDFTITSNSQTFNADRISDFVIGPFNISPETRQTVSVSVVLDFRSRGMINIWGNPTHLFYTYRGTQAQYASALAYRRSGFTLTRDATEDFSFADVIEDDEFLSHVFPFEDKLYVGVNHPDGVVYEVDAATKTEIRHFDANGDGICTNGETIWTTGISDSIALAYQLSDFAPDPDKNINFGTGVAGLWCNNEFVWGVKHFEPTGDGTRTVIKASLETGQAVETLNTGAAGQNDGWSDGHYFYMTSDSNFVNIYGPESVPYSINLPEGTRSSRPDFEIESGGQTFDKSMVSTFATGDQPYRIVLK